MNTNVANVKSDILCVSYRNQYDVIANNIVKIVFQKIKNGELEFNIDNVWIRIVKKEELSSFENFLVDAYIDDLELIRLDIYRNSQFSEKDYNIFNYDLYESIRHELEHVNNLKLGKKPDSEYFDTLKAIDSKPEFKKRVELVSKYMLSDTEVDAYARSMMYVAKKQNRHVFEVIEQVIKRAFFYNDSELMQIAIHDPEITNVINNVRTIFRNKLQDYYPRLKEKWI